MLDRCVLGFDPDLMIVDKRPAGIEHELLDTLHRMRRHGPRTGLVLGMRDILDSPERTRRSLERSRFFDTVERFYDEVWIYGVREIFDPVHEYAFPATVAAKTRFCGYLRPPGTPLAREAGPPRVVVTSGGGGDGSRLIEAYLDGLATLPPGTLRSTVVLGPLMPRERRDAVMDRVGSLGEVEVHDFDPDPVPLYATADVVVSMAGFNTVCELLSLRRRAVLVPRDTPVGEQLIRARRLAARNWFDVVEPVDLRPSLLIERVLGALRRPAPDPSDADLDGLRRIRERVCALLEDGLR
jgi:predicted glycosyltransferase